MQRDAPQYSDEYSKKSMHKEIGNLYMVDAYNLVMVKSALLTKLGKKNCCMLAVADHMLWVTLGVLFGRDISVTNCYMVAYI